VSLFDHLEAEGVVDATWMNDSADTAQFVLAEHAVHAVICMGWDAEMQSAVEAAEVLRTQRDITLLVVKPGQGPMSESGGWIDLSSWVDMDLPDVPMPRSENSDVRGSVVGDRSEAFSTAWQNANKRARIVMMAERFARQLP